MKTIDPSEFSQNQLHRMLLTAIAPRPIAFASTVDALGHPNLSPFSCFNVFGVNPGTLVFSPSRSGRENKLKDTLLNIKEVPEVVINTVTYDMVQQMNLASTEFPRGVDEFIKAGFTPVPSLKVRPFRVKESPFQIECRVKEVIETSDRPGAANLVICEVLQLHIDSGLLDFKGEIDPRKLDLVGRMGTDYYVRASGKALFTVEKPRHTTCIGVDALPEEARLSSILTGNDLGKLGMVEILPPAPEVEEVTKTPIFKKLLAEYLTDREKMVEAAHHIVHEMVGRNEVEDALRFLLAVYRHG